MIHLVVGGARSGKSKYALELAEQNPSGYVFIATAEAKDNEMAERIARHQADRKGNCRLIEEPLYLSKQVAQFDEHDYIVVDCMTLWLSNWLCSGQPDQWPEEKNHFIDALSASAAQWVLVSNEAGMGVTPMGELSRQFIDEIGWLHQQIAAVAERVTLVQFGLPQQLK